MMQAYWTELPIRSPDSELAAQRKSAIFESRANEEHRGRKVGGLFHFRVPSSEM
jgi:hypothetical protein